MPTAHRKRMMEAGLSPPLHAHDPRAVAIAAELARHDQALLDKAAAEKAASDENAARVLTKRRAAQEERRIREREARRAKRRKVSDA